MQAIKYRSVPCRIRRYLKKIRLRISVYMIVKVNVYNTTSIDSSTKSKIVGDHNIANSDSASMNATYQ